MPDSPSVGQPTSGTYGEGQDLIDLKKQLPVGAVGNPAPPEPSKPPVGAEPVMPTPAPTGRPAGAVPPPGIPNAVVAPTDMPHIPASTALQPATGPAPGASDPRQARMAILDALANDPSVGDETRQWARTVQSILLRGA